MIYDLHSDGRSVPRILSRTGSNIVEKYNRKTNVPIVITTNTHKHTSICYIQILLYHMDLEIENATD